MNLDSAGQALNSGAKSLNSKVYGLASRLRAMRMHRSNAGSAIEFQAGLER